MKHRSIIFIVLLFPFVLFAQKQSVTLESQLALINSNLNRQQEMFQQTVEKNLTNTIQTVQDFATDINKSFEGGYKILDEKIDRQNTTFWVVIGLIATAIFLIISHQFTIYGLSNQLVGRIDSIKDSIDGLKAIINSPSDI